MRLIDADFVLDGIRYIVNDSKEKITSSVVRNAMISLVERAKTVDAVQVVRCKDCKEWDEENHWCSIRDSYGWDYKPNDYCSYGKRREDDAID